MRFQQRLSVLLIVRHSVTQIRYLGTLHSARAFPGPRGVCQAPLGLLCLRDVQGGGTILRLVDAMNATHAGRELFSGGRRGLPQNTSPAAKPRRGVRQWAAGLSPVHVSGAAALLGRLSPGSHLPSRAPADCGRSAKGKIGRARPQGWEKAKYDATRTRS